MSTAVTFKEKQVYKKILETLLFDILPLWLAGKWPKESISEDEYI